MLSRNCRILPQGLCDDRREIEIVDNDLEKYEYRYRYAIEAQYPYVDDQARTSTPTCEMAKVYVPIEQTRSRLIKREIKKNDFYGTRPKDLF